MTPQPLPLREMREFTVNGDLRHLDDPDGAPSVRQLMALWHAGALAVMHPDRDNKFTRAEAAWAIAWLRGGAA